ncbi:MAG: RluA family pseudouridine synthase, partial [Pseudobdellovibrionaceae bacterium]
SSQCNAVLGHSYMKSNDSRIGSNSAQQGFEYGVKHYICSEPGNLNQILNMQHGFSETDIDFFFKFGCIYINHKRLVKNPWEVFLNTNDYIRLHSKPRRFRHNDFDQVDRVVYSDPGFYIVIKPSGLPCHPTVDNTQENLLSYLKNQLNSEDLFLTHRLDVATSGLIVLARNKAFQSQFNKMLAGHQVQKTYSAIIAKSIAEEKAHRCIFDLEENTYFPKTLTHYMIQSPKAPKKLISVEEHEKNLQRTQTEIPLESSKLQICQLQILSAQEPSDQIENIISNQIASGTAALIEDLKIKLITGRTHQIRAQLAFEGLPILGDRAYGGLAWDEISEKILLCSEELEFTHPNTNQIINIKKLFNSKTHW